MRCRHLIIEDILLYESLIENLARLDTVVKLNVKDRYDLKTETMYYVPKEVIFNCPDNIFVSIMDYYGDYIGDDKSIHVKIV
jgi:hypothetical protein